MAGTLKPVPLRFRYRWVYKKVDGGRSAFYTNWY
jgi:hypothetical protein